MQVLFRVFLVTDFANCIGKVLRGSTEATYGVHPIYSQYLAPVADHNVFQPL